MLGRKRVNEALALMGEMFPNAHGELEWETPFQLLVAVILSAQTTDKAVNKITPGLWARYPEIEDLASANLDDVEMCLRTIGLYKNKAKNIIKTARAVLMNFDGQVPKIPKKDWIISHHRMIFFGRYHCLAKNPKCQTCPLQSYCKYYKETTKK